MRKIRTSTQVQPQATKKFMMVRPSHFGFNEETAGSNDFQDVEYAQKNGASAQKQALTEFDEMVMALTTAGLKISVFEDFPDPIKPDAIFPNNWISFHQSGKVVLYPMMAPNRRQERRMDIVDELRKSFQITEVIDLTYFEKEGKFLEGTGSLVFDRRYRTAYACLSPRTHPDVISAFAEAMDYDIVSFSAIDEGGIPIYHTNVMLCVGDTFAVVCLDAVANPDERHKLRTELEEAGKYIISITFEQMQQFAGNMLYVRNEDEQKLLVMSSSAYHSLSEQQRDSMDDFARLIYVDIPVIEKIGGGSARCMLTEIHLPPL